MKYLFIIATLLFFSCGKIEKTEPQLNFSTKTFSAERCVGGNCAIVEANWAVAENASTDSLINKHISTQLLEYFHQDKNFDNLDSAAQDFLESFEDFKKDFPEAPGEWSVELEANVSYESDSTLSIKFSEFNYSGGAHPNSSIYYLNLDKNSGEILSMDQVIVDENRMLDLTEAAFRKYHEVEEGVELKNDGRFFLPETGFFLPSAIGYEEDKFVLTYIPYEIGPYVMGYTELEFDLKDLEGIVRLK